MAKKEHRFNPQTLTYEVITAPFRLRTYRLLRKILIGFILISVANVLFSYFFYTPKMYRINRANRELVMKYRIMQDRLKASERKIAEIRHRDQSVYRALFSTDTLSLDGIYTEYPSEKYRPMADDSYSSLMIGTWKQMDALARQLYLESVSFDQLQILAKNKEKLSSAIPATWPIDRNKLRNGIGAFGMRRHPIYGRYIMHKGIDFVKPGDPVVRGQLIAEAGRTGGVTGPHLHYEVMYMGQVVNPINYFNKDMTAEEYNKLMEEMHETTMETD